MLSASSALSVHRKPRQDHDSHSMKDAPLALREESVKVDTVERTSQIIPIELTKETSNAVNKHLRHLYT